jgi:hypothetical protein
LKDEEKTIKHKPECKEFVSDARESIRGDYYIIVHIING